MIKMLLVYSVVQYREENQCKNTYLCTRLHCASEVIALSVYKVLAVPYAMATI